jgi:predicted Zn-dependent protease
LNVPADDRRLRIRHGTLTADALEAAGKPDEARAALQPLLTAYPDNARLRERLEAIKPAR